MPVEGRDDQKAPQVRLLSLWRRTEALHWQFLCYDGGSFTTGSDGAEVSLRARARASRDPMAIDYAATQTWDKDGGEQALILSEEGRISCESHSSRLGDGAIPNRLWP